MKFLMIAVCLFGAAWSAVTIDGAWSSNSVDDPLVVELAAKGLDYENRYGNSFNYKKLITIKEARAQADKVSGINHEVKLLIGQTDCAKWNANATSCEVSPNATPELCTYVIWVSPDLHWRSLMQASCESAE
ncbi:cystatin-C-like [Tetranychus urticae]|uniref:Cystatin domain-containing protein n=1 Tax=Tetranychus urticae TaxID=32264 RepID=T1K834_TETUR|nr:cystatin-C-like [Tetranychus urticae]